MVDLYDIIFNSDGSSRIFYFNSCVIKECVIKSFELSPLLFRVSKNGVINVSDCFSSLTLTFPIYLSDKTEDVEFSRNVGFYLYANEKDCQRDDKKDSVLRYSPIDMKLYTCNDTCLYINRDYDIADMNKCSWHLSDDNNLFNSLFRRKYRLGSYRWSIKQGKPVLDFNVLEEFHFDVLKKSIDCKSCDKDGYFSSYEECRQYFKKMYNRDDTIGFVLRFNKTKK